MHGNGGKRVAEAALGQHRFAERPPLEICGQRHRQPPHQIQPAKGQERQGQIAAHHPKKAAKAWIVASTSVSPRRAMIAGAAGNGGGDFAC